jgi:hypothetical protein
MKYKLWILIPLAAIAAGCATGYCARGWCGGYSEIRTNPDTFLVTYNGNAYTHSDDAMRYVLLRASELTLQNGYSYFTVLSTEDQTSSYHYSNTYENASGSADSHHCSHGTHSRADESASSSTYSGKVVKPGTTIRIKCFNEKPEEEAIDARFYWENNKK